MISILYLIPRINLSLCSSICLVLCSSPGSHSAAFTRMYPQSSLKSFGSSGLISGSSSPIGVSSKLILSFTPVGNPAPPIPTIPAAFTRSSFDDSSVIPSTDSVTGMNSSGCSASGSMMMRSSVISVTFPYTLEKMLAPRPVGVAMRVPFFTSAPTSTHGAQGAPTCWRNNICTFPMTHFSFLIFILSKSKRNYASSFTYSNLINIEIFYKLFFAIFLTKTVCFFGGGMWESNPPRTLLTPYTSFED